MTKPKFSIITITYNASGVLQPTIESVISQDYDNIEYIIIDGASTDRTMDIVDRYRNHISHIVSEPDKGLYDAMNKGLSVATGDYVWFMNAGDSIHSADTVSRLAAVCETKYAGDEKSWPGVIYGETAIIDSNRTFKGMRRLKAPSRLNWRSFRMGMLVCHQSFIARRDIAPDYDMKYRFSADFDWCIKCMKASGHIANSNITIADYLDEGLTTNNRKASLKERLDIMKRNYGAVTVGLLHLWFAVRFAFAKIRGKEA